MSSDLICHCLKVTEHELVEAVTSLGLRSVREVRTFTGAGDGCNACHRKIQLYLDSYSSAEIFSAK